MNPRIQEHVEDCTSWIENVDGEFYEYFDKEKFAQLIVAECVGIYDKIDNGNNHLGTDHYPEAICKHFEIE